MIDIKTPNQERKILVYLKSHSGIPDDEDAIDQNTVTPSPLPPAIAAQAEMPSMDCQR